MANWFSTGNRFVAVCVKTTGKLIGMINRETLADQTSAGFQQGLDMYEALAMSARGFAWLTNDNLTRTDQINAGRAYARMNLTATSLGVSIHPWRSSIVQVA